MRKKRVARGSFRGVKFYIEEFSVETARRVERIEYPDSEAFSTRDLGAQVKTYCINGFVLGPDFEDQRDKLLAVCSKPGPGELDIPYFKKFPAHCLSVRTNEATYTGGMVTFTMTFCESSEKALEVSRDLASTSLGLLNDLGTLAAKALNQGILLYNAAGGGFITSAFDMASKWGDSLLDISDNVLSAADQAEKSFIPIMKLTYGTNQLAAAISEYKRTLLDTAKEPLKLFDAVRNLTVSICDPFSLYKLETLFVVMESIPSPVSPISEHVGFEAQEQREKLENTFQVCTQSVVLGTGASLAIRADYETKEDLNQTRESLLNRIDNLKEKTNDPTVYQTLESLKTLVFHTLQPEIKSASIEDYFLFTDTPAVVAAYAATGDISQLDAIITRNKISYPPMIEVGPGGFCLEVASP